MFPPSGPVVQLVRTLACHARGQGFESPSGRQNIFAKVEKGSKRKSSLSKERRYASVAQLVEQGTENPRVVGSIPTGGTTYADLAHLVERRLAKAKVAGSSPVIRSIKNKDTRSGVFIFYCAAYRATTRVSETNKGQVCASILGCLPRAANCLEPRNI